MYRYLHVDETGAELNTFNYTDSSNDTVESGVFTDWSIESSPILDKQYNEEEVVNIVSNSHYIINKIVEDYFDEKNK